MIHLANGYDFYWINIILFAMFILGSLIAGYGLENPALLNKKFLLIPVDKLFHFSLSFLLCLGFGIIQVGKPIVLIIVVPLVIGLLKEIWDYKRKNQFGWFDLLADAIGVGTATLIVWIIFK